MFRKRCVDFVNSFFNIGGIGGLINKLYKIYFGCKVGNNVLEILARHYDLKLGCEETELKNVEVSFLFY